MLTGVLPPGMDLFGNTSNLTLLFTSKIIIIFILFSTVTQSTHDISDEEQAPTFNESQTLQDGAKLEVQLSTKQLLAQIKLLKGTNKWLEDENIAMSQKLSDLCSAKADANATSRDSSLSLVKQLITPDKIKPKTPSQAIIPRMTLLRNVTRILPLKYIHMIRLQTYLKHFAVCCSHAV